MNLKQIEAFVKVANNRSFSQTAKELYLTQPTISAHISALEDELGVQLFVRTTKGVRVTEEGKKLYLYARQMTELEENIKTLFQKKGGDESLTQQVVIAASTIPAQYLVPKILAEYNKCYPNVQFRVTETDSAGVIEEVQNHTIDIGFTGSILDKRSCSYLSFYEDELLIVTPNLPKFRKMEKEKMAQRPDWILKEAIIMREYGSGTRRETEKRLRRLGIDLSGMNVVANMSSPEAIIRSVKSGIGITFISRLAAQEAIHAGEVLAFPLPKENSRRRIYMVCNPHYPLSGAVKQLIRLVKKMYTPQGDLLPAEGTASSMPLIMTEDTASSMPPTMTEDTASSVTFTTTESAAPSVSSTRTESTAGEEISVPAEGTPAYSRSLSEQMR